MGEAGVLGAAVCLCRDAGTDRASPAAESGPVGRASPAKNLELGKKDLIRDRTTTP
jgi:hypothetical protein